MDYTVWYPGGTCGKVSEREAIKLVCSCLDKPQDFYWEHREVGVDPEITWQDGQHEHKSLKEAVEAAIPYHRSMNLGLIEAALLCFALGLVVSTGVEIEEE